MFLKITSGQTTKKMKFPNHIINLQQFQNYIKEIFALTENFKLIFTDQEADEIVMQDDHDFEYFKDIFADDTFAQIRIEILEK